MSVFFSEHTFSFLEELGRHNNRNWFTANRARYERNVRETRDDAGFNRIYTLAGDTLKRSP